MSLKGKEDERVRHKRVRDQTGMQILSAADIGEEIARRHHQHTSRASRFAGPYCSSSEFSY